MLRQSRLTSKQVQTAVDRAVARSQGNGPDQATIEHEMPIGSETLEAEIDSFVAGSPSPGASGLGREKQADTLMQLARSAHLFHTPDGTGHADIDVNGHRETWPIRQKGFRHWLTRAFYLHKQSAPGSEAMQSALSTIEAMARFDGPERQVHVRVGTYDGNVYLDLGDEAWRAVEIDATGWRVIRNAPVRFRRAPGMKSLPVPTRGGSVNTLRRLLNVGCNEDFMLIVASLLAAYRGRGPYPVLGVYGEQGAAKSTLCRIWRALIDPNTAALRALPRNEHELFIASSNGYALAFDNVSDLPTWLSDALCRLATEGGFAARTLYTDQDETLFEAMRPITLNGIEAAITRPDLTDRSILLALPAIPEDRRQPEQELLREFERERPGILGALLDTVSRGLCELPNTQLDRLPRMADFAVWATACEHALWPAGTFIAAYAGNRSAAVESVIEADLVAIAVRKLMTDNIEWSGSFSELLNAIGNITPERERASRSWPADSTRLSGRVRRLIPPLRQASIGVSIDERARPKIVTLARITLQNSDGSDRSDAAATGREASAASVATDANFHIYSGDLGE
jgi:hypothetical protein